MNEQRLEMKYHPAKKEVRFKRFDSGKEIEIRRDSKLKQYMNDHGNFVLQYQGNEFFEAIAGAFDGEEVVHIPTKAQEVFDVSGAGDTVIAVFGLALAGGLKPVDGAYLANIAASVVVSKLGTYAVNREELMRMLDRQEGEHL